MTAPASDKRDFARIALATIRLINGAAGLFAPALLVRRLGVDPESNPAALYALRLFGVRTIVLGAALLQRDREARSRALRVGIIIHASDVLAALIAWRRRQLPARAAAMVTLISSVNTALALVASRDRNSEDHGSTGSP